MQLLNSSELMEVAGGLVCTCEEALINNVSDFDFDDFTKFCTKAQFTVYALGMIDLIYTPGFMDLDFEESNRLEIDLIKSLQL